MALIPRTVIGPLGLTMVMFALSALPARGAVTSSKAADSASRAMPTTGLIQLAEKHSRQRLLRQRQNRGGGGNNFGGNPGQNNGAGAAGNDGGFGGNRPNNAALGAAGGPADDNDRPGGNGQGFQPGYGRVENFGANPGGGDGFAAPPAGGYGQLQLAPPGGQPAGYAAPPVANVGNGSYGQLPAAAQRGQPPGYFAPPAANAGNGPPPLVPPRNRPLNNAGYQPVPVGDGVFNGANGPPQNLNNQGQVVNAQGQAVRPVYGQAPDVGQYAVNPVRPQYQQNGAYGQLNLANGAGNNPYQALQPLANGGNPQALNAQGQAVRPVYGQAPVRPQYQQNGAYGQLNLANGAGNNPYQALQPLANGGNPQALNAQGQAVRPVYGQAPVRPQYQQNGAYGQLNLANGSYGQLPLAPAGQQPPVYNAPPAANAGNAPPRPQLNRAPAVRAGLNQQVRGNGNIPPGQIGAGAGPGQGYVLAPAPANYQQLQLPPAPGQRPIYTAPAARN